MNAAEEATAEEGNEINLTPMLDVVFIMLIFFIVSAVFIELPGIDVTRPKAESAEAPLVAAHIAISQENEIWIAGSLVERDALRPLIERIRAASPGGELVIQADAESHSGSALAVMEAARAAGIESVVFAAERL